LREWRRNVFTVKTIKQWTAGVLSLMTLGICAGNADFDQPDIGVRAAGTCNEFFKDA
jgi:hypothetical protein